jgi:hypothetical protein
MMGGEWSKGVMLFVLQYIVSSVVAKVSTQQAYILSHCIAVCIHCTHTAATLVQCSSCTVSSTIVACSVHCSMSASMIAVTA